MLTKRKLFIGLGVIVLSLLANGCNLQADPNRVEHLNVVGLQQVATETIPPYTPLPSLTPSRTLKPPPTFEPPTQTLFPSLTPSITPTATINVDVSIPGLNGAETATPSSTPGCVPREDWTLTYTVQANDAVSKIAERYGTYTSTLADANCMRDPNVLRIGQVLRVPGESQPVSPEVECVSFELMTPANGTMAVEGEGSITFNWRGPRAPRNLIRIYRPDDSIYERVIELRQNEQIDLYEDLWQAGTYTWYVFPLDSNFQQACPEGGPWSFTKTQSPTATPGPTDTPTPVPTVGQRGPLPTPTTPFIIIVTTTPSPTEEVIDDGGDDTSVGDDSATGADTSSSDDGSPDATSEAG